MESFMKKNYLLSILASLAVAGLASAYNPFKNLFTPQEIAEMKKKKLAARKALYKKQNTQNFREIHNALLYNHKNGGTSYQPYCLIYDNRDKNNNNRPYRGAGISEPRTA